MATTAASAKTDRAIVVGVGNYDRYGPKKGANHLSGPVADATEIAEWLSGSAEVTLITSDGRDGKPWAVTQMRPHVDDVENPFNDLVVESIDRTEKGKPSRIARRLYIYMAGHGFMPEFEQIALVTAESIEEDYVRSLGASAWFNWFADQYHFDELVLWMDCCAERKYHQPSRVPLYPRSALRDDTARMFVAFAAKPSQSAYEGPVGEKGEVRGLFTAKLLKGLKGAAADSQGRVTSSSLKGYLDGNGLVGNTAVTSKVPDHHVPKHDAMLFATFPTETPKYRLLVPVADGESILVTGGAGAEVSTETVADGAITVALSVGFYKAQGAGFSELFEIAAGSGADVDLR